MASKFNDLFEIILGVAVVDKLGEITSSPLVVSDKVYPAEFVMVATTE